ncbi:NUDIX hydrolase [Actinorhabdospora filicis]|uniref:NUDIX hydrolase n=1 Tax=Actinorhabdospora filicis TaxID=1785913 RepID=A0A9W6WE52_9ACTN|nr:NUDIX domain-containing protein [Actinorhabdospora filicis]GLZ81530.1 NUDIX hydrolase [Actinorhabdospora filicis]
MTFYPSLANLAADIAVFTLVEAELRVLLIRRANPPFQGMWALPGGFVEPHEDAHSAARHELTEETGIPEGSFHLEFVAAYTAPGRDPRNRVASFAYMALVPQVPPTAAGGDAADAALLPVAGVLDGTVPVGFDHRTIIGDALEHARDRLENTTIAAAFCPPEFTVTELRRVYEAVWGTRLDMRNFHRKVTGIEGFLEPTGRKTTRDGGRPAELYRTGEATRLRPPMYRG